MAEYYTPNGRNIHKKGITPDVEVEYQQDENKIYAFYEGEADNKSLTHYLVSKLPKFMIPEVLVNVEAMPLTKNGKIDRKALMEEHNA